jgi:hypothetical protein
MGHLAPVDMVSQKDLPDFAMITNVNERHFRKDGQIKLA